MKTGKIYIFVIVIITISLCMGMTVNADEAIKIIVNNNDVGNSAKIIEGKVYVPLDVVGNNLNTSVNYNKTGKTVSIKSNESDVASIVSSVGPSVVGIIGKLKQSSQEYSDKGENLVFGTGVIYRDDGYIITNAHVVQDMDSIVVVLSNSKSYKARLKAIDESFDLAMIKIDKGMLKAAKFGDMSSIIVGDPVIAIGTPLSFSLRNSATKGIISGINRSAEGEYSFIQTDTAINSGNSGGPLVNMKGEVIGINSSKLVGYGIEGMSFSIPVDTVKYVMGHFEKYGKVRRPYLGAVFSEGVAARYGLPSNNEGLTIAEISKDSPAEKAGLAVDDVLYSVNGIKVATIVDYNEEMKKYLPGDVVQMQIGRNDRIKILKVKYTEKSDN
jgi:serine protease Do